MCLVRATDPRTHYAKLDGLRGIAILGVVICHVVYYWTLRYATPLTVPLIKVDALELLRFGNYGVSLFFLLSGYLLAITEEKRFAVGTYSIRAYALRRIFRLVPAYYAAILLVLLTWPIQFSLSEVLQHASFLHGVFWPGKLNLDPIWWSLTPEVAFYAILPLLVLRLRSLKVRLMIFTILVLVSLVTRLYLWQIEIPMPSGYPSSPVYGYLYGLPTTHLYLFLAGVLLKMLTEHSKTSSLVRRLASAVLVASLALFVTFPYLWGETVGSTLRSPFGMVVDLLVIALFASVLLGSSLVDRALSLESPRLSWEDKLLPVPLTWLSSSSYCRLFT